MNKLMRLLYLACLVAWLFPLQLEGQRKYRDSLLSEAPMLSVDTLVARYLEGEGIDLHKGNKLVLLKSAREKYHDLEEHIATAKRYIHLEYFNLRNDSISHHILGLLRHKAEEGIEVRILFDAFGNLSNDQPLKNRQLDSLRQLGINIQKFDPIRFPWVTHISTRDHRKLVIIDGHTGYLGGMNIADYYIKGTEKVGTWRDMHCRIEGTAVEDMQRIFASMWQKETKEELPDSIYLSPTLRGEPTQVVNKDELTTLAIVDRSPKLQPNTIKNSYALAIAGADSLVHIVNPYFVPTRAINKAIKQAIDKGVEVHIMVSSKSDIPFTPDAMLHKLRKLAKRGAKVHLYTEGFQHSKVMTVDQKLSTLGSANLNSRSLRYDYETNAFIFDKEVTAQLDSIYHSDMQKSIPLDDAYWRKRSPWKKFVGWFANLFTPFL